MNFYDDTQAELYQISLWGHLVDDTRPDVPPSLRYGVIFDPKDIDGGRGDAAKVADLCVVVSLWAASPEEAVAAYENFQGTPDEIQKLFENRTIVGDYLKIIDLKETT